MPTRTTPLITGHFYHIFNRGISKQPIFLGKKDFKRAMQLLRFYSFDIPKIRFSKFSLLSRKERNQFWKKLRKEERKLVELVSFCLLPNHFHLLLQQKKDNGISEFMSLFQNSFTRYFNTRYRKIGPILQGQFKAVRIEDEKQLLHLSRYIHLNPYSSFIVKKLPELENYPWSSLSEYLEGEKSPICSQETILTNFKNPKDYKRFVFDQANFQRALERIKYLVIEK